MQCRTLLLWLSLLLFAGEALSLGILVGVSRDVLFHNSTDPDPTTYKALMTMDDDYAWDVDYHLKKNLAFARTSELIFSLPLENKDGPTINEPTVVIRSDNAGLCEGLAVDWEHDRLYWITCNHPNVTIMSSNLTGGEVIEVLHFINTEVIIHESMYVDPYRELIFWLAGQELKSCTIFGDGFRSIMLKTDSFSQSIFLDLVTERIFYTSFYSNTLRSMDYQGFDLKEHFSSPEIKYSAGLSVFQGYAYFDQRELTRVASTLYKAPILLVNNSQTQLLKIFQSRIYSLRLVHPELQPQPCANKGCSHSCVVESPLSARCLCPDGQQLDRTGIICNSRSDSVLVTSSERSLVTTSPDYESQQPKQHLTTMLLVLCFGAAAIMIVVLLLYFRGQRPSVIQDIMSCVACRR